MWLGFSKFPWYWVFCIETLFLNVYPPFNSPLPPLTNVELFLKASSSEISLSNKPILWNIYFVASLKISIETFYSNCYVFQDISKPFYVPSRISLKIFQLLPQCIVPIFIDFFFQAQYNFSYERYSCPYSIFYSSFFKLKFSISILQVLTSFSSV